MRRHETLDKGHGRLEIRRLQTSCVPNDYIKDRLAFPHVAPMSPPCRPHVARVFRLTRGVSHLKSGKTSHETVHGITSLGPDKADAARPLTLNRGHWSIENRSHYLRDVTFDEDRSTVRTANGPAVMACLRNFAISLLRLGAIATIARKLARDCRPAAPRLSTHRPLAHRNSPATVRLTGDRLTGDLRRRAGKLN